MNALDDAILKGIVSGVEEMVWALASEDSARSADLLDILSERLEIAAQRDRHRVKPPGPKGTGAKL